MEIEATEREEAVNRPAFLAQLEGPGSTGKTSIQRALCFALYELLGRGEGCSRSLIFSEPPEWPEFASQGLPTPHRLAELPILQDHPEVAIPALAAFRMMMWNGGSLDGKPLTPETDKAINDPSHILIGSRSPLSLVYQGVYPGREHPWQDKVFELFYSWDIPFPDCLHVLIPDAEKQRQRLEERISRAGGKVKDIGDEPERQSKVLEGYERILEIIRRWPGVYRIKSQEITNFRTIGLSMVLAFHMLSNILEKGNAETFRSPAHWYSAIFQPESQLIRINTDPSRFRAYFYPRVIPGLCENRSIIFRKEQVNEKYKPIFYGDIGVIINRHHLISVSFETSDIDQEAACEQILKKVGKEDFTIVDENTRYGRNLYPYSNIERAWRNITW
jgi:hypothetical protein